MFNGYAIFFEYLLFIYINKQNDKILKKEKK